MIGDERVRVREAAQEDVPAISFIIRELGWFDYINEEPPADTEGRVSGLLKLCGVDESHMVLVAVNREDEVISYASVHWLPYLLLPGPEGFVSELFVRESNRGKGTGSELLRVIKEEAIRRRCSRLMLVTGRERLSYERGFYRKLDWSERPEISNFVLPLH
jgi:GNAT superfamily N-acetyltransferase